jgi:predicted TIM-barrel fold metal-dependent hydrolase
MTGHSTNLKAADIRAKLGHPIIDADGHMIEVIPIFLEYLKKVGGPSAVDDYKAWEQARGSAWYTSTLEQRLKRRLERIPFWMVPSRNTADRAACMLPRLMRSRLDNLGIDMAILYPTVGLLGMFMTSDDLRRSVVRAMNMMNADVYGPYADRLTPVALIPTFTPEEALAELDFVVKELRMKAVVIHGGVTRMLPPEDQVSRFKTNIYLDYLAMDSLFDYDPLWQKCQDLGVAVTTHTGCQSMPNRLSPTSFVFNHLGHFAQQHEGQCKAFVLGGVTKRFPRLNIAFMEGGVGWASALYNQMFEHWEKRNAEALHTNLNPALLDIQTLRALISTHGDDMHRGKLEDIVGGRGDFWRDRWQETAQDIDEYARSGIKSKRDIYERFVPNFFFGCEADDRMVPIAFDQRINRQRAKLKAMFSSDIGHWDVIDAEGVVPEAYEFLERGLINPEDFRSFMFDNAVLLHGGMNQDFFRGTPIEAEARSRLEQQQKMDREVVGN